MVYCINIIIEKSYNLHVCRKYVTIPSQENTIDINVSFLSNNIYVLNYCLENFRKPSSKKYFEFDSENVLKDFNGSTRNKS